MKVFVTGANGFIGSHLFEHAIEHTDLTLIGLDIADGNIKHLCGGDRAKFVRGDIFKDDDVIEELVRDSDVVLPLAGVARPAFYIQHPLRTFELDFEVNLKIVRLCAKHKKRLIFPSTSEVYGMCGDDELREDSSPLITGPIRETRWIYSTGKQMMDRVIFAIRAEMGLKCSIFRPFNWTGPRLDTFDDAKQRQARSITQMIYDVIERGCITIVGGGRQRRSFTWIGDGIDALTRMILDGGERTDGEIMNIGAPMNNISIKELAEMTLEAMSVTPRFADAAARTTIVEESPEKYYGPSYADTRNRVPSIEKISRLLDWRPTHKIDEIVRKTVEYYASL